MAEDKATPRPWLQKPCKDGRIDIVGSQGPEAEGYDIATLFEYQAEDCAEANAALIVKAVNSYDDLVGALREISSLINTNDLQDRFEMMCLIDQIENKAHQALARIGESDE